MRFQHVCFEVVTQTQPPEVVTSDSIESQLAPVYQKLGLPEGRLELMTGIRERRFWHRGTKPGQISALTAEFAIQKSGVPRDAFGCLIHGSVCRDQLEPATASGVHHALQLPNSALVLDVSNACLGLLNGMLFLANMIELGQVRAGVIVGTEDGRGLVEGTIDTLLHTPNLTRQDVKLAFASLTIGCGSAAIVLCDRRLSRRGNRLLGGSFQANTSSHQLCAGDADSEAHGDNRPRMQTDSEALLHAGVELAESNWEATRRVLGWRNEDVTKSFTHQVGKAHRKLLYDRLGLDVRLDYSTVEFLGNTGAAALPTTMALGIDAGHLAPDDQVALLGIGSGLNSIMLGIDWQNP